MIALVTGGAGFIGSHLVEALIHAGHEVRVLDDFSTGKPENLAHLPIRVQRDSILNERAVAEAVRGAEAVFHLAALVSVPASFADPAGCLRLNTEATLALAQAAKAAGVRRFQFASSSAIYGAAEEVPIPEDAAPRPQSPYAESKLQAEKGLAALNEPGFQCVSFRFFNVYGPGQRDDSPYSGVISRFRRQMIRGEPLTVHGDGRQTRDFVYVTDVVAALMAAAEQQVQEPLNVGTGTAVNLLRLIELLEGLAKREARVQHEPQRPGDVRFSCADIRRIQRELGWQPRVTLGEGLARMLGAAA